MAYGRRLGLGLALALIMAGATYAEDITTYTLTLEKDHFSPDDLKVPANKAFVLKVINKETAAVEIEAKDMKIEKPIVVGGEIVARVKAMPPGRYLLVNEYKEADVRTFITVE